MCVRNNLARVLIAAAVYSENKQTDGIIVYMYNNKGQTNLVPHHVIGIYTKKRTSVEKNQYDNVAGIIIRCSW